MHFERHVALHWVLKIGNLKESLSFFESILGLRVLRHEEFESGCEATCNGPYAGAWSKTMVGFSPESTGFALELTYNYGIDSYDFGNDLLYIALQHPTALIRAPLLEYDTKDYVISGPDSYKYKIIPSIPGRGELFVAVAIRVSSLVEATEYYTQVLSMSEFPLSLYPGLESQYPSVLVGYAANQTLLQLIEVEERQKVNHAQSAGRIAFACPSVKPVFDMVTETCDVVQVPPLTFSTPGKADVVVTILQDRDEYEICCVEDVAFYQLAQPTYDVIDWQGRALKGGDGAGLKRILDALEHSGKINDVTTNEEVEQYINKIVPNKTAVVLYFGASWCNNCKKLAPFLEEKVDFYGQNTVFLSVNIDEAEHLAVKYNVSSVPHVVIITQERDTDTEHDEQNSVSSCIVRHVTIDYIGSDEKELNQLFAKHLFA